MTGKLFVEPFGGLGNRMRVLVSSLNLARTLKKDLKIVWRKGPDFNCGYHRLYESNALFEVTAADVTGVFSSYNRSPMKRLGILLINKLKGFDHVIWEQDHGKTFFNPSFKPSDIAGHRNIYIRSCEQYFGGSDWHIFHPIQEFDIKIKSIQSKYTSNTIGIHVRRKDNLRSIQFSPLDVFCKLMAREQEQDGSVRFYVSTDDQTVERELLARFPAECLIFHRKKEFSRDSEEGIQDSLVDMHCLSTCKKIIGSYWSSFSEVSSYLHQRPLVFAMSEETQRDSAV